MTSDDFTPKYKRRWLLARAKLAAGTSVLPSEEGKLNFWVAGDAEAKVKPVIVTSHQNVGRVVFVCRDQGMAATSLSNSLVSVLRNLWSNSIPRIKLQLWRLGCYYRYKFGRCTLEKTRLWV